MAATPGNVLSLIFEQYRSDSEVARDRHPVRAGLVSQAQDWRWSSTRALIARQDDHVVTVAPVLERVGDFAAFLGEWFDEELGYAALRRAESVGRPIGSSGWLVDMEAKLGRPLTPQKRGPRPKREMLA